MDDVFIVVAILPNGNVRLYGDANGKPYESESAADIAAKRIKEDFFWSISECAPSRIRINPKPKVTTIGETIGIPPHG